MQPHLADVQTVSTAFQIAAVFLFAAAAGILAKATIVLTATQSCLTQFNLAIGSLQNEIAELRAEIREIEHISIQRPQGKPRPTAAAA